MTRQLRIVSTFAFVGGTSLVILLNAIACSDDDDWKRPNQKQCPAACEQCLRDIACAAPGSSGGPYCPIGTTCDASTYAGAPAVCSPNYFPSIAPTKLLDGFQVNEFLLTRDSSAPGQFTF